MPVKCCRRRPSGPRLRSGKIFRSSDARHPDSRVDLHRVGPQPLRVHRQARRPGPAFHALGHRAGGPGRPDGGLRPPRAGLRNRAAPRRPLRRVARARPGRRLSGRREPAGGDQDPPRPAGPRAREPPRAALGAAADLWRADRGRPGPGRTGAGPGLCGRRHPDRNRAARDRHRGRTAGRLRGPLPRLRGLGGPGSHPPCRARRRAGRPALPARRVAPRPAPAGRSGLPRRGPWPLPAGAGAHRHRQDPGHALPAAAGDACPAARQDRLHDLQGHRPPDGARCASTPAAGQPGAAAARADPGRQGAGLRAPGQGLPRRRLHAGPRLLRPPARRARRGGAAGLAGPAGPAPHRAGPRHLPLLPRPGAAALGGCGGGRRAPCLRPARPALRPGPGPGLEARAGGGRGAQPRRARAGHVQRHAQPAQHPQHRAPRAQSPATGAAPPGPRAGPAGACPRRRLPRL
mmetsp:Transcript_6770/g.28500  ORF Transcript_6770/g.28500 Transcript_6770/m.28500 type:complete len:461 (-) Transcript_6770:793-2175(-)